MRSGDFRPGYLPQKNSVDSHFPITVAEVIASGLLAYKNIDKAERQARIEEALGLTGLADLAARPIGRLSGGQLQRALLGRAIVARPDVLILDEPLSYLDRRFEQQLYNILSNLRKGTTVLLVSHQISQIDALANRHVIVDHTLTECTRQHHYTPNPAKIDYSHSTVCASKASGSVSLQSIARTTFFGTAASRSEFLTSCVGQSVSRYTIRVEAR